MPLDFKSRLSAESARTWPPGAAGRRLAAAAAPALHRVGLTVTATSRLGRRDSRDTVMVPDVIIVMITVTPVQAEAPRPTGGRARECLNNVTGRLGVQLRHTLAND